MVTVKETVESGISPITLDFSEVSFFENGAKMIRTFLTVNSLEIGVLTYRQYRFVARRTKLASELVKRHIDKLVRRVTDTLAERPDVACFTIPVYAKLLVSGELYEMLSDSLSLYPEIPRGKICIEISADILYEDLKLVSEKVNEIRSLGVKVAVFEVGDEFCPIFRLSEITFDYAVLDAYSASSVGTDDAERVAGSLIKYLHYLDVRVIVPGLDTEEKIASAKSLGADGYTSECEEAFADVGGDVDG